MTAGLTELMRWADLADHLTRAMQATLDDFVSIVECKIEEHEEAGSVSTKHKKIKERLKVLATRRVAIKLMHFSPKMMSKVFFSGRTRCVCSRNRSGNPRCTCKRSIAL